MEDVCKITASYNTTTSDYAKGAATCQQSARQLHRRCLRPGAP